MSYSVTGGNVDDDSLTEPSATPTSGSGGDNIPTVTVYQSSANSEDDPIQQPPSEAILGGGGGDIDTVITYETSANRDDHTTQEPPQQANSGEGGDFIDVELSYITTANIDRDQLGESPEAEFLDVDGLPLTGVLTIFEGEEAVSQGQVTGKARIPGPVPVGVPSGSNVEEGETYNLVFEPSITGVNYVQEDYINNPTGTIQYGSLQGQVTDVDGNPVPEDSVEASGLVAITDDNGNYEFVGPGGTETTVLAAGATQSIVIDSGITTTVDFTYSRLTVRVLAPDNTPVRGTKLTINDKRFETDENGEATIDLAPVQTYTIELGEFQTQEVISGTGEEVRVTIGNNAAGVKITVADATTGRNIEGTTVQIGGSGVVSRTRSNGQASSIGQNEGATPIIVGQGDRRYVKRELVANLTRGKVIDAEVELARRNNTPTL